MRTAELGLTNYHKHGWDQRTKDTQTKHWSVIGRIRDMKNRDDDLLRVKVEEIP